MPPLPSEVCLLTVFVDVHYYFSAPTPRPLHHRFDKGSYLYVYHDAAQNKARMEIANHPGMPEQDAFCGSLGAVHLRISDKFPTLCTLIVDTHRQSTSGPSMPSIVDQNEWLLLNIDPRDESRAFLRLHTLDLYFWTSGDATLFLQNARKLLAPAQLDIIPASQQPQAHEVAMSSVVQKLENVAITDPAYHNGQTRDSRTETVPIQQPQPQLAIQNFPPPPAQSAISEPVSPLEAPSAQPVSKQEEAQINYTPIAYNPSAPAAPEPIKPREQTPPPPDGVTGTGLAAAAVSDSGQAFAPPPMSPGFPPPPPNQAPGYGGQYASPPPTAGLVHTSSFTSHSSGQNHNQSGSMSFAPPPTAVQAPPSVPGVPGAVPYTPPPQDPNTHLFRQQSFGPPPASPHSSAHQHYQGGYADYRPGQAPQPPQAPMSGYSSYSYGQSHQQPPGGNIYDVHHQVYRPTEVEGNANYIKQGQRQSSSSLGKGVGKFLKKLDKL
ncbi:RNA recognition motif-containing protein [Histoplasma capsulatum]|uniref:RNA recognition motif-containing protein n=1 Tax=Ajellomyces capsulatus TaxID=5037 RepID=A0A8A1MQ90_AJECA|nr:predicted protein [Histoplasma mississippiense (nom. inval.)]EDN11330.1 predicted protein [Histoplasma mississippiense (nom. inval.)]QSS66763.1 RNA recognition motif-containing protein [Histoplasma capsulatum]